MNKEGFYEIVNLYKHYIEETFKQGTIPILQVFVIKDKTIVTVIDVIVNTRDEEEQFKVYNDIKKIVKKEQSEHYFFCSTGFMRTILDNFNKPSRVITVSEFKKDGFEKRVAIPLKILQNSVKWLPELPTSDIIIINKWNVFKLHILEQYQMVIK